MNISYIDAVGKSLKEITKNFHSDKKDVNSYIIKNVPSKLISGVLEYLKTENDLMGVILQDNTKITVKEHEAYLIAEHLHFNFDGINIKCGSKNIAFDYNEIIENSLNEIYIFNKQDLKFAYVNSGAIKNLGFTLEEMKSMTPLDIKPEHSMASFKKLINPLTQGLQKEIIFETIHERKNGSTYPVEVHLQLIRQNGKEFFSAIILDISEKIKAINEINNTHDAIKILASNYPNGSISLIDADLNFLFTEGEGYQIHGMDPATLIGQPAKAVLIPSVFDKLEYAVKNVNETTSSFSFDVPFENKIYQNTCKPILNKKGEFQYFVLRVLDVTNERRHNELLTIERNNYEAINGALNRSALISITDCKGIIIHANEVFCLASKYTYEELIGNSHNIINSGHHPKEFWVDMWQTILAGKTWRAEVKNKAKDGSFYWVDTVVNPIYNIEQKIESFLSIRYLITDRKEMEKRREELTNRFVLATKAAKMGVWSYEVETGKIFWDEKMLEIYRIESFDGKWETFQNIIHEQDRENELKAIFSYIEDENVFEYDLQYRLNTKDNEEVYVRGKAIIERENGKAKKITGLVWEITEEKLAENALKQLTNKLRIATQAAKMGVWKWDLTSNNVEWDDYQYKLHGVDDFDGSFEAWKKMLHPDDLDFVMASVQNSLENNIEINFSYRIIKSSGEIAHLKSRGIRSQVDGKDFTIGVNWDVTEEKLAENALKQLTNKLRIATQAAKLGVWNWDLKTNYVEWDEYQYKLHGVDDFDGSFEAWKKMIHPDDVDLIIKTVEKLLKNNTEINYSFRIRKPSGEIAYLKSMGVRSQLDGKDFVIGVNWDVTEEKLAEEKLRKSEEKFSLAIKGSNDGYFDVDLLRNKTFYSQRFFEILGIENKDLNEDRDFWKSVLHSDDKEKTYHTVKKAIESTLESYEVESRLIHGDGHYIPTLVRAYITRDKDGIAIRVTGTLMDLTSIKLVQADLKQSEEKYALVLKGSNDGIFDRDLINKTNFYSARWLEIHGLSPDLKVTSPDYWHQYIHPDDISRVTTLINEAQNGKASGYEIESRRRHSDGHYVPVLARAYISRDSQGKAVRVTGLITDLTKTKETEKQIIALKDSYEALLDSLDCVVWESDAQTFKSNFVSKQVSTLFGYSADQWKQEDDFWFNHVHPEDQIWLAKYLKEELYNKRSHDLEYRFEKMDGSYLWIKDKVNISYQDEKPNKLSGIMIDITDIRNTQNQLVENEEKFRFIAENTSDGIMVFENDQITYISEAYADILGYDFEEEKNHNMEAIFNLLHPEDRGPVFEIINRAIENKLPTITYEFRAKHKKGHYIWREDRANFIYNDEGNHIKTILLARDITEKKKIQIALQESEEKYRYLVESSQELTCIHELDGRYKFVSSSITKIAGYEVEELLGKDPYTLFHPDDIRRIIEDSHKPLLAGQSNKSIQYRFRKKEGDYIWFDSYTSLIKDEKGRAISLLTGSRDITELKNTELALEKTLKKLNLGIETGKFGMWELDLKTGYLDWNDQMYELFGVAKENFSHSIEQFREMVDPHDLEIADLEMSKISQGETVRDIRFKIKTTNGEIKHVYASGTPSVNDKGEVDKFIGINIDVTNIAENQLQLEKSINEKDALFKELHHRIKNNLQMVSSLLYIKSSYTTDQMLKEYIRDISAKIHSISSIHEQLLQLKGINQLDIGEYLASLVTNLVSTYSDHKDQYPLKIGMIHDLMDIDKVLNLGLIVNEIISNSIKYAYPETKSGPIEISLIKWTDDYILTVSDRGIGIPKEKILSPDQSYGMQLVDIFTQQIKGQITIENKNGTVYTIKFKAHV